MRCRNRGFSSLATDFRGLGEVEPFLLFLLRLFSSSVTRAETWRGASSSIFDNVLMPSALRRDSLLRVLICPSGLDLILLRFGEGVEAGSLELGLLVKLARAETPG